MACEPSSGSEGCRIQLLFAVMATHCKETYTVPPKAVSMAEEALAAGAELKSAHSSSSNHKGSYQEMIRHVQRPAQLNKPALQMRNIDKEIKSKLQDVDSHAIDER